jgi:hypothetical protein
MLEHDMPGHSFTSRRGTSEQITYSVNTKDSAADRGTSALGVM